jgi:hypothetical protein
MKRKNKNEGTQKIDYSKKMKDLLDFLSTNIDLNKRSNIDVQRLKLFAGCKL